MKDSVTRRRFLTDSGHGTAAGAAAISLGVHSAVRAADNPTPKDTVNVGLIGCGGMGRHNWRLFMDNPEVRVVAVADPDSRHAQEAVKDVAERRKKQDREPEQVATHEDFRELLDNKEIDAIICGTPDHWHALVTVLACQAGKDVYCEKPISHNIVEGRRMVNAVKRYKRVCQIGTQQRSGEHFQKAIELVRREAFGKVILTRTWNYSQEAPGGIGNGQDGDPPKEVNYDLWLGPAPKRPFNSNRFHYQWRWFFDYASGMVGDWNVHLQDIVHLAMQTGQPKAVSCSGGKFVLEDNRDTPDLLEATYEFEGPNGPFVQMYSMRKFNENNGVWPTNADQLPQSRIGLWSSGHGIQFVGSNGTMYLNRGGFEIVPETKREGDKNVHRCEPIKSGGSAQNEPHVRNFLDCVKSRELPRSHIESMHETTLCCHLANIAMKVGRKIYWDAAKEQCYRDAAHKTPDTDANALLGREYRKPWELPKVEV
jgi:predicted dehydrogenase